jgi:hypothetical protein
MVAVRTFSLAFILTVASNEALVLGVRNFIDEKRTYVRSIDWKLVSNMVMVRKFEVISKKINIRLHVNNEFLGKDMMYPNYGNRNCHVSYFNCKQ